MYIFGPQESKTLRRAQTRNGSTRHQRNKNLKVGMPITAVSGVTAIAEAHKLSPERVANGDISGDKKRGGVLGDYLIQKPTNVFRNLLQTGVSVVQGGIDTFGQVSTKMYEVVRKTSGISRRRRNTVAADESDPGYARRLGRSVVNMIGTGLTGMEEITDLSVLLGNIGTEKIRSKLNGENGNREIFKMLVKYVGTNRYRYK